MEKKKTAPTAGTVKVPMDILEIGVEGYSKIIVMQNKQLFEGLLDQNKHLQPLYGVKDYQTALYPDLYVAGIKEMNTEEGPDDRPVAR